MKNVWKLYEELIKAITKILCSRDKMFLFYHNSKKYKSYKYGMLNLEICREMTASTDLINAEKDYVYIPT